MLAEVDGPMLLHRLQGMAGTRITRPALDAHAARPGAARGAVRGVPCRQLSEDDAPVVRQSAQGTKNLSPLRKRSALGRALANTATMGAPVHPPDQHVHREVARREPDSGRTRHGRGPAISNLRIPASRAPGPGLACPLAGALTRQNRGRGALLDAMGAIWAPVAVELGLVIKVSSSI